MAEAQNLDAGQQDHVSAWKAAGEPSEQHRKLAGLEGDWNFTTTWWASAEAPGVESSGTSTFAVLFDGRYVEQQMTATVLGEPYEGRGVLGFDKRLNRYVSSWIDNRQTSITHAEGTHDDAGAIHLNASHHVDPLVGDAGGGRLVLTLGDEPSLEWHDIGADGQEFRASETRYSRA